MMFHKRCVSALRIRLQGKLMQSRLPSNKSGKPAEMARGSGGLACLLFVALLACSFWLGAIFASHPLVH
jgi:hypothetical protein